MHDKNWIGKFSAKEAVPADLIPQIPIIEICGRGRVLVENHQGILAYDCKEIKVKVICGTISICGEKLMLSGMNKEKLLITGHICAVNLG